MNDQELETKELTLEQPKTRKKKFDPNEIWTKCKTCLETGNLENLIKHKISIKSSRGAELHGAFEYVYFCSENCKGLFGSS